MYLQNLLKSPIDGKPDYLEINKVIKPWVNSIYTKENPHFYRGFSLLLSIQTIDLIRQQKITLFLFFTLLPHFYITSDEKELLFLKLIKSTPKLDFEKTINECMLLYYTCVTKV